METEGPTGFSSIQCAGCGGSVARTFMFPDGHVEVLDHPDRRRENGQELWRCPHCGAENVLIITIGATGWPEYKVAGLYEPQGATGDETGAENGRP